MGRLEAALAPGTMLSTMSYRLRAVVLSAVLVGFACGGGSGTGDFSTGLPHEDRVDRLDSADGMQLCDALSSYATTLFGLNQDDLQSDCVLAGWAEASLTSSASDRQKACKQAQADCVDSFSNDQSVQMPKLACHPEDLEGCRVTVGDYESCVSAFNDARVASRQALQGVNCSNVADFIMRNPSVAQPQSSLNSMACATVRQQCPNFFALLR
jgi:hypothetical protein